MDLIETHNPNRPGTRLLIAGGWNAWVPDIQADRETHEAYVSFFSQNVSLLEAKRLASECVQGVFEGGYLHLLRMAIQRRAHRYAKMFPALVKECAPPKPFAPRKYFSLLGFDPEEVQSSFVPNGNGKWEEKLEIERQLRAMGMKALQQVRVA